MLRALWGWGRLFGTPKARCDPPGAAGGSFHGKILGGDSFSLPRYSTTPCPFPILPIPSASPQPRGVPGLLVTFPLGLPSSRCSPPAPGAVFATKEAPRAPQPSAAPPGTAWTT